MLLRCVCSKLGHVSVVGSRGEYALPRGQERAPAPLRGSWGLVLLINDGSVVCTCGEDRCGQDGDEGFEKKGVIAGSTWLGA